MLDAKTITDKYSVAEYALIYLGGRQPSPMVRPGIRYCVEESAGSLYQDKNHEVMIFDNEAQAFEFRQILRGALPVLAFYDRPMPEWDGTDEEVPLNAPEFADVDEALA